MDLDELETIVDGLPFESRLGYVAFCVDRCLKEAQRHAVAARQLEQLPLLRKGLALLWDRAEQGAVPSREVVDEIGAHLSTYASYDPANPNEGATYNYDVALVWAANTLRSGLELLKDPTKSADFVVDVWNGITQVVGAIYADPDAAQAGEERICESALVRLRDWGSRPLSRAVFDGIPERDRGEISDRYASGRVTGHGGKHEED